MTDSRSQRIYELFHAALPLSLADRKALLDKADPDLRAEVERLLAQDTSPLDRTAWGQTTLSDVAEGDFKPGTEIGPYIIKELIGAGGMGDVYRAVDTRLHRAVAIKTARYAFGARSEREARAIAQLNHPHICTLFDVGPNYLVMELVEGETLAARLKKGRLTREEVLNYSVQIADALAAAHSKGIVHRDLKPGNIMLTAHGVKVLDFGLAKLGSVDDGLTRTGTVMGTLEYMSPEQVQGEPCTPPTDLFACGLILFEMATGKLPIPGASLGNILASDPASANLRFKTGLSLRLDHLISQLLAAEPDRRPPGASAVRAELQSIRDPKSRALSKKYLALAALLVLVTGVLWVAFSPRLAPLKVSRIVQIAPFPGDKRDPALSPDGRQVAFSWTGEKGDSPGIYFISTSGGEPRRLTRSESNDISPAWSPDSHHIVFLRVHPGQADEVMMISNDRGIEEKIRDVRMPELIRRSVRPLIAWTNDGTGIVLPINDSETSRAGLFRIVLADSSVGRMTRASTGIGDTAPAISADGKWFAYYSMGGRQLLARRIGATGSPEGEAIIVDNTPATSPVWSPTGAHLLYVSGVRIKMWDSRTRETQELYLSTDPIQAMAARWSEEGIPQVVFSVDGGAQEIRALQLEDGGHRASGSTRLPLRASSVPTFSADGRWIAFASVTDGVANIWMADPHGEHARQITDVGADRSAWAPDGKHLAFHGGVATQLYVADIDPESEILKSESARPLARQVVQTPFQMIGPDWSPDSSYVYATRPGTTYQIMGVSSKGGQVEELFEGDFVQVEPNSHRIYYGKHGIAGIFSRSVDGDVKLSPEDRVLTDYISPRGFDVNQNGIFYLGRDEVGRPAAIRFYDFALKKSVDLWPAPLGTIPTIAVNPDSTLLLYDTRSDATGRLTFMQFERTR